MNKRLIVEKIIARLDADLENYANSARSAHEDATHEQSKAENKYDTRGLEASYLAHGQSKQAMETRMDRMAFDAMRVRNFGPEDPIDIGAYVAVEGSHGVAFYFIGPRAGGTEIYYDDRSVLVVSGQSPLGRQLIGAKQGAQLILEINGERSKHRVTMVE